MFEHFKTRGRYYMVLEYCSQGSLAQLLNNQRPNRGLGEDMAKIMFRMLVKGMCHIHDNGIVHRDIKCANILLDKDMNLKIADFGLGTKFIPGKNRLLTKNCGTRGHKAPEVTTSTPHDGRKADVWSMAIVLCDILTGRLPFDDACKLTDLARTLQRLQYFKSSESMKLVRRMVKLNPNNRPTTENILDDPWLKRRHRNNITPTPTVHKTTSQDLVHMPSSVDKLINVECMQQGYIVEKTIGNGRYGTLKLATVKSSTLRRFPDMAAYADRAGIVKVVIEVIERKKGPLDYWRNIFLQEMETHCNLPPHKNVVRMFENFEMGSRYYSVMEYCSHGNVKQLINNRAEEICKGLGEKKAKRLFGMMAEGVHHIHTNGVVHRDLNLSNLLLDKDDNLKIADFGNSTKFIPDQTTLLTNYCGTYGYNAPEVVECKPYDGTKSDIWSMAIILCDMLNGRLKFHNIMVMDREKTLRRTKDFESIDSVELVRSMVRCNPTYRPTTAAILKNRWLTRKVGISRQMTALDAPKSPNQYQLNPTCKPRSPCESSSSFQPLWQLSTRLQPSSPCTPRPPCLPRPPCNPQPPCTPKPPCLPRPPCNPQPPCTPRPQCQPRPPCKRQPPCTPRPPCTPKPPCQPRPPCKQQPPCTPRPPCTPKPPCQPRPPCKSQRPCTPRLPCLPRPPCQPLPPCKPQRPCTPGPPCTPRPSCKPRPPCQTKPARGFSPVNPVNNRQTTNETVTLKTRNGYKATTSSSGRYALRKSPPAVETSAISGKTKLTAKLPCTVPSNVHRNTSARSQSRGNMLTHLYEIGANVRRQPDQTNALPGRSRWKY